MFLWEGVFVGTKKLGSIHSKRVYSSGQVGRMLRAAPRTVSKWCDSGKLRNHRLPGSNDRRITEDDLIAFATQHGMAHLLDALIRPLLYIGNVYKFEDGDIASSWLSGGYLLSQRSYLNVVLDCRMGVGDVVQAIGIIDQFVYSPRIVVILNEDTDLDQFTHDLGTPRKDIIYAQHPVSQEMIQSVFSRRRPLLENNIRLML